jgi:hypothetical protein
MTDQYKAREKKKVLTRWASLKSQGKAVKAFMEDDIANARLFNPKIFWPSKYVTAVKMRAKVVADKASLMKAKTKGDIACRKCHVQKETLGHILSVPTQNNKGLRDMMESKIFVLKRIVEKDKEAVVTRDPILCSLEGEVIKPDLVVKNRKGSMPRGRGLSPDGKKSKIDKYARLLPDLHQGLISENGEVLLIVIRTRGALPKHTIEDLEKLCVKDCSNLLTISLTSLHKSFDIYNKFMDYDAHPGGRNRKSLQME